MAAAVECRLIAKVGPRAGGLQVVWCGSVQLVLPLLCGTKPRAGGENDGRAGFSLLRSASAVFWQGGLRCCRRCGAVQRCQPFWRPREGGG